MIDTTVLAAALDARFGGYHGNGLATSGVAVRYSASEDGTAILWHRDIYVPQNEATGETFPIAVRVAGGWEVRRIYGNRPSPAFVEALEALSSEPVTVAPLPAWRAARASGDFSPAAIAE